MDATHDQESLHLAHSFHAALYLALLSLSCHLRSTPILEQRLLLSNHEIPRDRSIQACQKQQNSKDQPTRRLSRSSWSYWVRPSDKLPSDEISHVSRSDTGEAAVGKSSCVMRFVQNDFQENKEPTIGAALSVFASRTRNWADASGTA